MARSLIPRQGRHPSDIRLKCAVCGVAPDYVEYDNIFRASALRVHCHGKREVVTINGPLIDRVAAGEEITVFADQVPEARKNGCHNKPRDFAPIMVQDGYRDVDFPTGDGVAASRMPKLVEYAPRFNTPCQYTHTVLGKNDTGCAGCVHRAES